jgi:DNA-binding HxlR family transcriptional regulator
MPIKTSPAISKANLQSEVKDGVNAVIDLFHRRWTMRILWELRDGPATFRELQAACSMVSSSVLNVRISELREAQLVEHSVGEGYQLSSWGKELLVATQPLAAWARRWSKSSR